MDLLTHSRIDCFKTCRKKHQYCYELGIRKTATAKALRIGTNGHDALEVFGRSGDIEEAMKSLSMAYQFPPDYVDIDEWDYEHETLRQLIAGYIWRWQDNGIKHIATEQSFRLPLINPVTSKTSRTFELAGKIDGIVEIENGRLAVFEHKFLGESIDSGADLWKRTAIDHQITMYMMAARMLGYDVDTVIYDVIRKPTIKPCAIPIIDENGIKIVNARDGSRAYNKNGTPRQTALAKDGFLLRTRPMTTEEWGEKLNADIGQRPEYYYARQEVPRLEGDIRDFRNELWDIAHAIRDARNNHRWYRTANKNTCSWCSYYGLCTTKFNLVSGELPEGFEISENLHPELELENATKSTTTTARTETADANETIEAIEDF